MVKVGMKVFDYERGDLVISYGDTEAEIISLVRVNHNDRISYDRSEREGVERFFLNVADRGEYCEFQVADIKRTLEGSYDDKTGYTVFPVAGVPCLHDGAVVHCFDMTGYSVGTGVYSEGLVDGEGDFVFLGDYSMYEDVGLLYVVKGDRVFLSAGICMGHVHVEQITGNREYMFMITEESDEV